MIILTNQLITEDQENLLHRLINAPFKLGNYENLEGLINQNKITVEIREGIPYLTLGENIESMIEQIRDEMNAAKLNVSEPNIEEVEIKNYKECRLSEMYEYYYSLKTMLNLGEYIVKDKKIILYPKAMLQVDSKNIDSLLQTTFVHEVMHAYFNRDKQREMLPYILQVEEPLAEFGMLLFFKETNNSLYNWAYNNVKSKRNVYGIGAEIMDLFRNDATIRTYFESYKLAIDNYNERLCCAVDVLIPCATATMSSSIFQPITRPAYTASAVAVSTSSSFSATPGLPLSAKGGVDELSTWELVNASPNLHFTIPSFQRGYRWDEKQVCDLCQDLLEFIKSTDSKYYLQPLVVKSDSWSDPITSATLPSWEVLDGQQRLTTMLLVLHCICQLSSKKMPLYEIHYTHRPSLDFNRISFVPGSMGSYPNPSDNLDSHYVSEAITVIADWYNKLLTSEKMDLERCLLYQPTPSQPKEVKFIWYNLDSSPTTTSLSSLQLFNRLNGGKIGLTGSELIKSLFYLGLKTNENASITYSSLDTKGFIMEWDMISRQFENDEFWGFISSNKNKNIQTRIDLLFNTIQQVDGKETDAAYRKYQNDFVNKVFPNLPSQQAAKEIYIMWKEVREKFDLMMRWYENVNIYNYVGFLVENGKSVYDIINFIENSAGTISSLQNFIKTNCFKNVSTATISSLSYEKNSADIRRLLLLFNVETYRCHTLRFPFVKYREGKWDLEHVNSQTENTIESPQERLDWLRDQALECLSHETDAQAKQLFAYGNSLLANKTFTNKVFETYRTDVVKYYNSGSNANSDGIDNLTLLNSSINRMYQNALYPSKRLTVSCCDQMGEFIPLCTRYLFLKYYSSGTNANRLNMLRWNKNDQDDYLNAIKQTLLPIIK